MAVSGGICHSMTINNISFVEGSFGSWFCHIGAGSLKLPRLQSTDSKKFCVYSLVARNTVTVSGNNDDLLNCKDTRNGVHGNLAASPPSENIYERWILTVLKCFMMFWREIASNKIFLFWCRRTMWAMHLLTCLGFPCTFVTQPFDTLTGQYNRFVTPSSSNASDNVIVYRRLRRHLSPHPVLSW